jgi:hypothetical protein
MPKDTQAAPVFQVKSPKGLIQVKWFEHLWESQNNDS